MKKTARKSSEKSVSSLHNGSRDATGLIYLFTGDGKGKTSAALGTAARALGNGWRVVWIAFYKEASWGMSEYEIPSLLSPKHRGRFQMYLLGRGFYIRNPELEVSGSVKVASISGGAKVIDDDTPDVHREAAQAALAKAREVLAASSATEVEVDAAEVTAAADVTAVSDVTAVAAAPRPQVLILDEICNAVSDGLVEEQQLFDVLDLRGPTHVVLTGRSASAELQKKCDLVSEIMNRKHPYDSGQLAVKGLDY